jgi:integrase
VRLVLGRDLPAGGSIARGENESRLVRPPTGNGGCRGRSVEEAGLTGVHFHDLRHAGNHYTANTGANPRELVERMGRSTNRAAMIYLRSTDPR